MASITLRKGTDTYDCLSEERKSKLRSVYVDKFRYFFVKLITFIVGFIKRIYIKSTKMTLSTFNIEESRTASDRAFLILLSIILHFLFLYVVRLPKSDFKFPEYTDIELQIEQDNRIIIPEPLQTQKKIIVPESDVKETEKSIETPFLASKNTIVTEERIRRGDAPDASQSKPSIKKVPKTTPIEKKTALKKEPDTSSQNKISDNELSKILDKISSTSTQTTKPTADTEKTATTEKKELQSKEALEGRLNALASAGISGNPDILENIRDGEVTLLNAKADRFAVFVRRVALQVFNAMRTSNWYEVGDISRGLDTGEVLIRAVLDKSGTYKSHEILISSGIPLFDKIISQSVKKGAWDRNPPQSALTSNQEIVFIFKSKAYVRASMQGRSRQWIQLGTGLE